MLDKKEDDVYVRNGYRNRSHYLQCIAEDYDVPLKVVYALAGMLGPCEDFDSLVNSVEDYLELVGA